MILDKNSFVDLFLFEKKSVEIPTWEPENKIFTFAIQFILYPKKHT